MTDGYTFIFLVVGIGLAIYLLRPDKPSGNEPPAEHIRKNSRAAARNNSDDVTRKFSHARIRDRK